MDRFTDTGYVEHPAIGQRFLVRFFRWEQTALLFKLCDGRDQLLAVVSHPGAFVLLPTLPVRKVCSHAPMDNTPTTRTTMPRSGHFVMLGLKDTYSARPASHSSQSR